jgi:hypothetical protein
MAELFDARVQAEAEQRARAAAERERERLARERADHERSVQRSVETARHAELIELERARLAELERAESEARARRAAELCLAEERSARHGADVLSLARMARQRMFGLVWSALCVATWLGGVGLYFGLVLPDAARNRAALERAVASEHGARIDAAADSARAAQRSKGLSDRVSVLERTLHDERAAYAAASVTREPAKKIDHSGPVDVAPSKRCVGGADGDPLNPCLTP